MIPANIPAEAIPFLRLIYRAISARIGLDGWDIESETSPERLWIYVTKNGEPLPDQGWKLHISSGLADAEEVLTRALQVLLEYNASFKVARSIEALARLNSGGGGLSQIGKFITVYPRNEQHAVELARELDRATQGLRGPAVASDRQFAKGSLLYYRYGSFGARSIQTSNGTSAPAIQTPEGALIPDWPTLVYDAPEWVADPFEAAGLYLGRNEQPVSATLSGRYVLVALLHISSRGAVYLGIDLETPVRCILKQASRNAAMTVDGIDACDRLRNEARVLALLQPNFAIPSVIDLLQQGDELFLVLEDIEGVTLAEYVAMQAVEGKFIPQQQVAAFGIELTRILDAIHLQGVAYRDLKSSNILITPNSRVRLVDFELAAEVNSFASPTSVGTRGYASPQQSAGERSSFADDIYALGAVLYFMATNAEPSLAPDPFNLLKRPLELINPCVTSEMAEVIARCLDPDLDCRYSSAQQAAEALEALIDRADNSPAPAKTPTESSPEYPGEHMLRYAGIADKMEKALCASSVLDTKGGSKRTWTSTHSVTGGIPARDLNAGSAGSVLALSELVANSANLEHRQILAQSANSLSQEPQNSNSLPGLYVGSAGICAALLRAGQVLNSAELVAAAFQRSTSVASAPHSSPDLFNGSAGRLRLHLLLWDETAEPEALRHAIVAGEALLKAAHTRSADELCWTIPPGFGSLSGNAYLGYAHGAAGIADALLDLYEASGDERYADAARRAGLWLSKQALQVLEDGSGLDWPIVEGAPPAGGFWCRGSAGIGRFFLNASRIGILSGAEELASRAEHALAYGGRWIGPTQCHGLAGSIEFVLDMYQSTGDPVYLEHAWTLARLLESFVTERDGLLVCTSESPTTFTPDYMVGYAGVAVCFLRLSNPSTYPHQLSRRGFRYTPHHA